MATEIEWTDETWNPMVGCSIKSDGCKNCYAMRQGHRLEHNFHMAQYQGTTERVNGNPVWTGRVNRASDATLRRPYGFRHGTLVFVNSMSDFFHERAEDTWRHEALAVMLACPQHYFQILTKRPENIQPFAERAGLTGRPGDWFPPNVWIGATVENAKAAHRIDTLRAVPAAVRFLSCEPLIGPIGQMDLTGIHWVIAGGESGPGARPMDPDWVRSIRDQCQDQGVPYFLKQFGTIGNNPLYRNPPPGIPGARWVAMNDPVGKGGSKLDGRAWKEWPTAYHGHLADLLGA